MYLAPILYVLTLYAIASGTDAFYPYIRPGTDTEKAHWKPVMVGENDAVDYGLSASIYPDNVEHPAHKLHRTANRAAQKYRLRGFPEPDIDGSLVVKEAKLSMSKSRTTSKQHEVTETNNIGGGFATATATSVTILPAETPNTPDSMGVSQDGNDYSYFSAIMFGTNKKSFNLVVDTGSADTWIRSQSCESEACKNQRSYSIADSSTLQITQETFDIKYGSGDVKGTVASDTVSFAGFELTVDFGLCTEVSEDFVNYAIDGILGMGFSIASQQKVPTIMDYLVSANLIQEKLFGVSLSRATDGMNNGVVNFGGVDATLYEGELSFTDTASSVGLWELPLDGAGVDGNMMDVAGRTAVVDTGTSLILIPPSDAMQLHSSIPGAETNGESFAIPCNTTATIHFTFSGVSYDVLPEDYIGDRIASSGDLCLSLITGRQILGTSTWLLGDVFLKNVYSVFDLTNSRIGLAKKKQPPPKNSIDIGTAVAFLTTDAPSMTALSSSSTQQTAFTDANGSAANSTLSTASSSVRPSRTNASASLEAGGAAICPVFAGWVCIFASIMVMLL